MGQDAIDSHSTDPPARLNHLAKSYAILKMHLELTERWYVITPSISKWHRVSMLNAEDLFALATDKTTKWLNDIAPGAEAVSALA